MNYVDLDKTVSNKLIRIYTVCHSVLVLDINIPFLDGFSRNLSFKIAMFEWMGVGPHPRFTLWLTFFKNQSIMP